MMPAGSHRLAPVACGLTLALLGACAKAPPEPATGPALAEPTDHAAPIGPTSIVGGTLRHVAALGQPVTARIAFGDAGTWWHWEG